MRRSFRIMLIAAVCGLVALAAACSAVGTPAVKGPEHTGEKASATESAPAEKVGQTAEPTVEPTPAATAEPTKTSQLLPPANSGQTFARISLATDVATSVATATLAPTAAATPVPSGPLTPITLFLTYTWNIQFAPLYVAKELGYFREAGIDVTIEHSFDEVAGLTRIATDNLKFGVISGEQVLLARAQGAPVTYVFAWYQKFPVGIVAPASANLTDPKQLKGKIVGVPAKYGASYMGLQALLFANGMTESDLKDVRAIGFDTAPVVCGGTVEASVVYIANEPAQIEKTCFKTSVINISDFANMVSNGLVTNEKTIAEKPELVRGMVQGFARGLEYTIAHPDEAYAISQKYVENLAANDQTQMNVLANSIKLWRPDPGKPTGYTDPDNWQRTLDTLVAMKLITDPIDLSKAFTNEFLPR